MQSSTAAAAAAATAAATAGFTVDAADDVEDEEDDEEQGDDWSFLGRREAGVELNNGDHVADSSTAAARAESHVVETLFDLALVSMADVLFDNLSDPCLETVVALSADLGTTVLSSELVDDPFVRSSISNVQETEAPFSTINFIIDDE